MIAHVNDLMARLDVAIVGGGCSGTLLAIQLLRQGGSHGFQIALIEPGGRLGRGIAYGTTESNHLLNVPAARMSALPEEPDHFIRWLRVHQYEAAGDSFLPRRLYGDYVEASLQEAEGFARMSRLERWNGRVVSLTEADDSRGVVLRLADGRRLRASRVVLATGNSAPAPMADQGEARGGSPRYVNNPWNKRVYGIGRQQTVLILGTGLTAVDAILSLRASGHLGAIKAVSRHGLLPQAHRAHLRVKTEMVGRFQCESCRGLFREIRRQVAEVTAEGGDWRQVIDSLRSQTPQLWQGFSDADRSRFLRHLRAYWDNHRHRIPAEVDSVIQSLQRTGQLAVSAGRILGVHDRSDHIEVEIRPRRAQAPRLIKAALVLNCTGPASDIRKSEDPLLSQMLRDGTAQSDALGLGLILGPQGQLVDSRGRQSPAIFALGPLRKGQLWESTAVPEIRVQSAVLAAHLLDEAEAKQRRESIQVS